MSRLPVLLPAALTAACAVACSSGIPEVRLEGFDELETQVAGLTVAAASDAFVRSGSFAGTNFGAAPTLEVDGADQGTQKAAYLRFRVGAVGTIRKATLSLYVINASPNSFDLHSVADTGFGEASITWNNRPAPGPHLGSVVASTVGAWVHLDVTGAVAPGRDVAFALMPRSNDGIDFASKEAAANRPRLTLALEDGAPPSVTFTYPTPGASVGGDFVATGTAADDGAVVKVELSVNGGSLSTASGTGTWSKTVSASGLNAGTHTLTARATDAGGNVASASVSFAVLGTRSLLAGPLVGAVSPTTANLWAYAGGPAAIVARYRPVGAATWAEAPMPVSPEGLDAARVTLTSLQGNTRYEYQVKVDQSAWSELGRFKTAPAHGPVNFKFAFGSCYSRGDDPTQPSWRLVGEENVDFYLHLGDSIYLPSDPLDFRNRDPQFIFDRFAESRRLIPSFADFIRNHPVFAVWDDHDYGPNNSGGLMVGDRKGDRAASLRAFKAAWANPSYGTAAAPGVYFKFSYGDVDFFMLDGRYYRDGGPGGQDTGTQVLGPEQLAWLIEGLKASTAKVKFLAMGSPIHAWGAWATPERNQFIRAVNANRITGLLYLSGDPHRVFLRTFNPCGSQDCPAYTIYDAVSSGLGIQLAPPTRGYATYEVDTTQADPTVRLRLVAGNGATSLSQTGTWQVVESRTFQASALKGAGW